MHCNTNMIYVKCKYQKMHILSLVYAHINKQQKINIADYKANASYDL